MNQPPVNASYANTLESSPSADFFSPAQVQLNTMIKHLETIGTQDHRVTEKYLSAEGDELKRLLLQGHLNLLAHNEQQASSVTCADGHQRNHVRKNTQRKLTTLFGSVTVTRRGYSQRQQSSLFPMDASLNLYSDQYTDGIRERIVQDVIDRSYDRAIEQHRKTCSGIVGKRQAMQLAESASCDFVDFYAHRAVKDEQTDDLLILSFDGKGLVMLPDGLRECTRKSAEKSRNNLQTRLSPGEKKDRKRMAQVATVYTVLPHIRTAESVINRDKEQDNVINFRPPVRNKRVFASVERTAEQVIEEAFDEALKRDPENKRQWVIVVDGHPHQLSLIEKVMARKRVDAMIIMDFIHVLEYLWKAAYCLYEKGSEAAESWVCEGALRVLRGESAGVARGIRQSASKRQLKKREAMDKCAGYLQKNQSRLRYGIALAEGLPIASGVIEGACRHLINDRMDITGARWSLQGAEAILKLRSINSSGDWDEYWNYHRSRSASRNYGDLVISGATS